MKKFLVPVAVIAAAFSNANASQSQEVLGAAIERFHQDTLTTVQGLNALASLLMIPAVSNVDTITQLPQHRSHSSHGSHRSHYSSRY
jgi:hypothetical protein